MDEISQEILLETYEKFMKIRASMSKANKRYLLTDKGKQKKIEIQRIYVESKKDDTEYRLNINRMQRERYKKRVEINKEKLMESLDINQSDI